VRAYALSNFNKNVTCSSERQGMQVHSCKPGASLLLVANADIKLHWRWRRLLASWVDVEIHLSPLPASEASEVNLDVSLNRVNCWGSASLGAADSGPSMQAEQRCFASVSDRGVTYQHGT
jgi:hypothetical protein